MICSVYLQQNTIKHRASLTNNKSEMTYKVKVNRPSKVHKHEFIGGRTTTSTQTGCDRLHKNFFYCIDALLKWINLIIMYSSEAYTNLR